MQRRLGATQTLLAPSAKIQAKILTIAALLSTAAIISVSGTAQAQDIGGFLGGAVGSAIGSAIRGSGGYHPYQQGYPYQYQGPHKRKHHKDDGDEEASSGSTGSTAGSKGSSGSKGGSETAGAKQDPYSGSGPTTEYHEAGGSSAAGAAGSASADVPLARDKAW